MIYHRAKYNSYILQKRKVYKIYIYAYVYQINKTWQKEFSAVAHGPQHQVNQIFLEDKIKLCRNVQHQTKRQTEIHTHRKA